MKKLILTLAIVFSLSMGAMAQGGLFQRGETTDGANGAKSGLSTPLLPGSHNSTDDADAEPLTDGVLLLAGLGAAYLIGKKKKD